MTYILQYSGGKTIRLFLAETGVSLIVIFLLYLVLSALLGNILFYEAYKLFIYLYLFVVAVTLLTSFINYYRQRNRCKAYQIEVNNAEIIVRDSFKKKKLKFNLADIKNYTVIDCGYSIYEAIKLEIKGLKIVMIYSLMSNYGKFKKEIKKSNISGVDYIYKPLGYTEKNIF